jgi:hypothetical protein
MPLLLTTRSIAQLTQQHTSLVTGFRVEQMASLVPGQMTWDSIGLFQHLPDGPDFHQYHVQGSS